MAASRDLEALEETHRREEGEEAARDPVELARRGDGRALDLSLPAGGALPSSRAWLDRLEGPGGFVREKKPAVFDHLRSFGPYLCSVDDPPLSVIDGMSQTATLTGGFSDDHIVRSYYEGGFGDTPVTNRDTTLERVDALDAYVSFLRSKLPELPEVTFTHSGAEANEKALALARLHAPASATKVLAFEGSFHGRTLLALHATYNPAKREPFQIPGYEALFAPWPLWEAPGGAEPAAPEGFFEAAAAGRMEQLTEGGDALLAREIEALRAVQRALSGGEVFACIVEPMQSEGGDRYATARFHRALRLLTAHFGVALIYDEVQCGFGLGGPFFWHQHFDLRDLDGRPLPPDAVTVAKRAQLGVVLSRYQDPEPVPVHVASLVRGRLQGEVAADPTAAARVEALWRPRLAALATSFPSLVARPRGRGYAFAFDLPSAEHLKAYLAQRFYRGVVVFGAGDRTVRYRLSRAFEERHIEQLFAAAHQSLAWIEAHPGEAPPAWEDAETAPAPSGRAPATERWETRVRGVSPEEAAGLAEAMIALEAEVYEPARREPPEKLRRFLADPEAIVGVAELREKGAGEKAPWSFAGFALAVPLERVADVPGPDRDPMLGHENTAYSVSITLKKEARGLGLGRALKVHQIEEARRRSGAEGRPRYLFVSGRNRVGFADGMARLNRRLGAHVVFELEGQYGDPEGRALYYRIPIRHEIPSAPKQEGETSNRPAGRVRVDLASGLLRPFATPPKSLATLWEAGALVGPTVNKITLCNYVTPSVVRAAEWMAALTPGLPRLYVTSGRDELLDKALRILKWHRSDATVAIGLEGGYLGHVTAAARSLSDPAVHRGGPAHFAWPRVPHPAQDPEATLAALREAVTAAGGPAKVLGLFWETVQERTGAVIPQAFWEALEQWRQESGIPVVLFETASALGRSGAGPFRALAQGFVPDALAWWGGGQHGWLHVTEGLFVDKPLTFVSTWDGDELSLIRDHHHARAARRLDLSGALRAMERVVAAFASRGLTVRGAGLYRVVHAGEAAETLRAQLAAEGILLRALPAGRFAIAPPLDVAETRLEILEAAVEALPQP